MVWLRQNGWPKWMAADDLHPAAILGTRTSAPTHAIMAAAVEQTLPKSSLIGGQFEKILKINPVPYG
jgi:hypothetical protein